MNEFNWGDPYPGDGDLRVRCDETKLRFADHFQQLSERAAKLFKRGHGESLRGLRLFDEEFKNLCSGWAWVSENWENNRHAAEMCQDYPLRIASILDVRLPARTRIVWLEHALEVSLRLQDRRREGLALGNLGIAYKDVGHVARAIECHKQQLLIADEINDDRLKADALGNLSSANLRLGRSELAIEHSEAAASVFALLGDRRRQGTTLGNIGIAYKNLGEFRLAVGYHRRHLEIARDVGDLEEQGMALGNLGIAFSRLGRLERAMKCQRQRIEIAHEIGDARGESDGRWNLALCYAQSSDFESAIRLGEESIAYLEETDRGRLAEDRATLETWRIAEADSAGNNI